MSRHTGGRPPSELALKIIELLEDGEWHDYEKTIREAGKIIPPGRAMRRAEQARRGANPNSPSERARPLPPERLVATGRRYIVRDGLRGGHVETKTDSDGVRWVRLTGLPDAVASTRTREQRERDAESARAAELVELRAKLRAGADPHELLSELPRATLLRFAVSLAHCEDRHIVEVEYNTDADGRRIDETREDHPRTLHGPFETIEEATRWMDDFCPDDTDIHDIRVCVLNGLQAQRDSQ